MTTVQTMLTSLRNCFLGFGWGGRPARPSEATCTPEGGRDARPTQGKYIFIAIAFGTFTGLTGCESNREVLTPPEVLVAPYDLAQGEALWAVAPLRNESGVSLVDPLMISDALVSHVEQTRGLTAVPLNRTLAAMTALQIPEIRTPDDVRQLADALGVDGLIVGTITSYDPYNPPKLGLTLALYARPRPERTNVDADIDDPMELRRAYTDPDLAGGGGGGTRFRNKPASVASAQLDAASHEVQMQVKRFAEGRHDPRGPLGWKRYLASMELYTDFAAYSMVRRLLLEERLRLAQPTEQPQGAAATARQTPSADGTGTEGTR